jgi:hypothetical protein
MKRREFIACIGGAAAAWPRLARGQPRALPVIGFFHGNKPGGDAGALDGIRAGLRAAGFIEGKNFVLEYRWAEKHFDRNAALAADLVSVIRSRFLDYTGVFMLHCHMMNQEELGMMQAVEVYKGTRHRARPVFSRLTGRVKRA